MILYCAMNNAQCSTLRIPRHCMPDAMFNGCKQVLDSICNTSRGERLAIVADPPLLRIGEEFLRAGEALGAETVLAVIPVATSGKEPPKRIARLLLESDVFVIPTTVGMTHTKARKDASNNGARGVTMPGVTEDMLSRPDLFSDYTAMAEAATALASRLGGVEKLHVVSHGGTDLAFDVTGSVWFAEGGLCHRPGQFSNAPGGEVSIPPVNTNGILVVDGSITGIGLLDSPLRLTIKDGWIAGIEGDAADRLREVLSPFGENAFHVAEIGIGMNPAAQLTGKVLEDEKSLGTIHVGLGDNTKMGGVSLAERIEAGIHIDAVVVSNPELRADGVVIEPSRFFSQQRSVSYDEHVQTA